MTTENATGISDRIDIFLGHFDHSQIVTMSYVVSAVVLLLLILSIETMWSAWRDFSIV